MRRSWCLCTPLRSGGPVPLLQQRTPASQRRRWQGTRASFVELVTAVVGCMHAAGHILHDLDVSLGSHSGRLTSVDELDAELTEAIWLSARDISVSAYGDGAEAPSLTVMLAEPPRRSQQPALSVLYYSGTAGSREIVRNMVERILPPDQPDPRRHGRWLGPLLGLLLSGTLLLIISRTPPITGIHAHASTAVKVLGIVWFALYFLWFGWWWTRLLLDRWFPAVERLPDTGETRWSRARVWIGVAISVWVAVVAAMLALPER
jgi:hypothetical protein